MRTLLTVLLVSMSIAAPEARAIWLSPDVVDIPTERLVANLEAALANAPDEERPSRLVQLARLHSAAYALKRDAMSVVNPITWSTNPVHIKGSRTEGEVLGAFRYLVGRNGNLLESLRTPRDYDKSFRCDSAVLAETAELSGAVRVSFTIPAGRRSASEVAPTQVRIVSSTLTSPSVGACLRARIAREMRFRATSKASKVDMTIVFETRAGPPELFFGFGQFTVPEQVLPQAENDAARAKARAHLARAKQRYEDVLALEPNNALAHLGLAWILEQDGQISQAIAAYRNAFREAWRTEGKVAGLGLGAKPIAFEAAAFLLNHLDSDTDAAERAELAAAMEHLSRLPRPITPIIVPLGPTAALTELLDPASPVRFDLDGSGLARAWGWIRPEAAFLVWDPAHTGITTSGIQMLGSVSFWLFWSDGYAALAALDDNRDGTIAGTERDGLALWHDANANGVSDPGEVKPVGAWGIESLGTCAHPDVDGTPMVSRGVVFADGTVRPTWDWTPTSR